MRNVKLRIGQISPQSASGNWFRLQYRPGFSDEYSQANTGVAGGPSKHHVGILGRGLGNRSGAAASTPTFTMINILVTKPDEIHRLSCYAHIKAAETLIDGKFGPKTADALERWPRKNDFAVDGLSNRVNLEKLRKAG